MEAKKEKKARKPINMSKGSLFWKIWSFSEAGLLILLGALCFVLIGVAENSNNVAAAYQKIVSEAILTLGIILIVIGALRIAINVIPALLGQIVEKDGERHRPLMTYGLAIIGSLELAAGIALVSAGDLTTIAEIITKFMAVFAGVVAIVTGANLVIFGIAFILSKIYKTYVPIISFIVGGALMALGIVVLIFLAKDSAATIKTALAVFGSLLVIAGVTALIMTINAVRAFNLVKKTSQDAIIDEHEALDIEATAVIEKGGDLPEESKKEKDATDSEEEK